MASISNPQFRGSTIGRDFVSGVQAGQVAEDNRLTMQAKRGAIKDAQHDRERKKVKEGREDETYNKQFQEAVVKNAKAMTEGAIEHINSTDDYEGFRESIMKLADDPKMEDRAEELKRTYPKLTGSKAEKEEQLKKWKWNTKDMLDPQTATEMSSIYAQELKARGYRMDDYVPEKVQKEAMKATQDRKIAQNEAMWTKKNEPKGMDAEETNRARVKLADFIYSASHDPGGDMMNMSPADRTVAEEMAAELNLKLVPVEDVDASWYYVLPKMGDAPSAWALEPMKGAKTSGLVKVDAKTGEPIKKGDKTPPKPKIPADGTRGTAGDGTPVIVRDGQWVEDVK